MQQNKKYHNKSRVMNYAEGKNFFPYKFTIIPAIQWDDNKGKN